MSDVIKLLPDSVANQIAAGEVIQRPASVIKELVENSIDAGATSIQIILKDAGRTLIQVIDNGCGMSDTDARLSFERHSTSKIRKAQDLFSLHTMGFRGEALASIAAISQLELRTQKEGSSMGTKILISASKCENQEPIFYGKGSNFMIKNIFFNVPARRKFLKSNQVELNNILKEFEKLALVNHEVDFQIMNNDHTHYQLLGGSFKQRIVALFGHTFESQLIPINVDTSLIKIEGFVCKPENARKRNQQQFFFVNGRYMRHPYFHKAVMLRYNQLIPDDEQPNYFLNFTVNPETIDVNIHPTKTEIKFENEQSVWQIISAAVKEALGKFSLAPSIDFDTEDAPEIPVFSRNSNISAPSFNLDPSYNPFNNNKSQSVSQRKSAITQDWQKLYNSFIDDDVKSVNKETGVIENETESQVLIESKADDSLIKEEISTKCIQIKGRYILSQVKSGLMIIDQHRAHVKILYEKLMSQRVLGKISSQRILFPEVLQLSVSDNAVLNDIIDKLRVIGFDLSFLGNCYWSIIAVPSGIDNLDAKDTILSVVDSVSNGEDNSEDSVFERITLAISQKSAIPYGKILSSDEMDSLQCQLLQLQSPNYTPDGKLIIQVMPIDNINKMFQ